MAPILSLGRIGVSWQHSRRCGDVNSCMDSFRHVTNILYDGVALILRKRLKKKKGSWQDFFRVPRKDRFFVRIDVTLLLVSIATKSVTFSAQTKWQEWARCDITVYNYSFLGSGMWGYSNSLWDQMWSFLNHPLEIRSELHVTLRLTTVLWIYLW